MRLSAYIADQYKLSRRFVKSIIRNGDIMVNGRIVTADMDVSGGEDIHVNIKQAGHSYSAADYVVSDAGSCIFFYKPPFMHSERHTPLDPLCLEDIAKEEYPEFMLISRLDYGVDGVVAALRKNEATRSQRKKYLAWVDGLFPISYEGIWDVDAHKRRKVKAFESYSGIKMRFARLESAGNISLVEIELEEARRHQVRAVCAALGHPILGDPLYGTGEADGRIWLSCVYSEVNGIFADSPHTGAFISRSCKTL